MRRVMRFRCPLSRFVKSGQRPTKIAHTMVAHQTSAHIVAPFSGFRNESKVCLLFRSAGLCTIFVAEEMGDILIPSLMVGDCSHSLCVRVSRLWEFLDPQDDSRLLHTDLVLLDEEFICKLAVLHSDRDTGPTVDVVLWGERATTFPAEQIHRDSGSSPQIIIFVGTLVRSYADNVSLSGGSSCKWYINAPVPEVNALRASAETKHQPVIWDQGKAAAEGAVIAVPEHRKLKDIKYLHPFENKKKEWLVIVKILKIDRSWWYNACKKCLRTTKPHGDTYKCTNSSCDSIRSPTPSIRAGAIALCKGLLTNQCDIQTAPHQGDNLLQGTEIVTSPPNMQAPSGAAYSVLDGSTNKAHKSVTGKRARTSPSNKVAKKLFRDEDTGDDDVAGSGDVDAE
ncbi:putative replication protein [Zea mays]|uniref:Putative replication protein n=1 Tax=Zea mays TaxID=4577 RepID=A0A1D6H5G0_MAIZE|nr:putative replication protein [Zea mays]